MADQNVFAPQLPVGEGERVGFCQDCGRALTASTVRTVGSGVFCEPCLERRIAGSQIPGPNYTGTQYPNPPFGTVPNPGAGPGAYPPPPNAGGPGAPPPPYSTSGFGSAYPPPNGVFPPLDGSTPHPVLAGFLGLIPGVGAMYNGQFGKGIVHLIVFAVLVSLSDNVNGVFGFLVAGWIFYMAFEAYHTARARRLGLPLPDIFGLNNIGDRMGLKNWNPAADPSRNTQAQATGQPPDWVGYVPPTNFATTPPDPNVPPAAAWTQEIPVPPPPAASNPYVENIPTSTQAQAAQNAGYVYTPPAYSPTFTAAPLNSDGSVAAVPPVPVRRFPSGAIWLIALGLVFLIGNIDPHLRLGWHWMLPVILAATAIWVFSRRIGWMGAQVPGSRTNLVCMVRGPVLLMTLAIMFALQAAHWLTIGQTWPLFIIALGGLLFLERAAGRNTLYSYQPTDTPPPPTPPTSNDSLSISPARWTPSGEATVKGGQ